MSLSRTTVIVHLTDKNKHVVKHFANVYTIADDGRSETIKDINCLTRCEYSPGVVVIVPSGVVNSMVSDDG